MKKYIKSNSSVKPISDVLTGTRTHSKYRVRGSLDEDRGIFWGQVSRICPYDDADYYWARITGNGTIEFIYKGKIADKMQWRSYEEDDYESVWEYASDMVDEAVRTLDRLNSTIEPRMIHN